ncbi:hypothetical protein [Winogradskyella endarachnes]|uniref:Uncharacterized protein n=1 Tax=Winogradskyella endarachnes TaxID=2681965 RepID=A0A6L6U8A4_9FLAO|nr:hypothetical protein [Winogradskyella endarachnes]MUU78503.1 hypothetical protein [Winogradskyella endarachnes]
MPYINFMNPFSLNSMLYNAKSKISVAIEKNNAAIGICQIGLGLSEMMMLGFMFSNI